MYVGGCGGGFGSGVVLANLGGVLIFSMDVMVRGAFLKGGRMRKRRVLLVLVVGEECCVFVFLCTRACVVMDV